MTDRDEAYLKSELEQFDFELPEERIALHPANPRDSARMLAAQNSEDKLIDSHISDIGNYLKSGDVLVFNNSRVIPAALSAIRFARDATGRDVEVSVNLLKRQRSDTWLAMLKPARRIRVGDELHFEEDLTAKVEALAQGQSELVFCEGGDVLDDKIDEIGAPPLPPYILSKRERVDKDKADYQTHFAEEKGSVAAPTAGLHFTPELISKLKAKGVIFTPLTLHVGAGTFLPLTKKQLEANRLHFENYTISRETAQIVNTARRDGRRIIPIGTTALRTLEAVARRGQILTPCSGNTDIFIRPNYEFKMADGIITNFHLPKSSLFMLVCAFMGIERMQAIYRHAIANDYRFFSYGDACLLLRG